MKLCYDVLWARILVKLACIQIFPEGHLKVGSNRKGLDLIYMGELF